jgi:malonyl-CoA/methylmalonyl-CoA synthetase
MLEPLREPTDAEALRFGDRALTYAQLAAAAGAVAARLEGCERVAVWAEPTLETCVGVVAGLLAGVPVVALNPKSGSRELEHVIRDSAPARVLCAPGAELPAALAALARVDVDPRARGDADARFPEPPGEAPALIVYTSGTTGAPKGAVLPRRAIAADLDGLAQAWEWTEADALVHGLPLFHVHGLVLGVLGPLRRGGRLEHVGRFTSEAVADALARGGTMLFGVPTMYHRLAADAEHSAELRDALRRARLLVSGSAGLPGVDRRRIEALTGQRVLERYGMTETLITTAAPAAGDRPAGTVGPPVPGVEIRLRDDDGALVEPGDEATIGEIEVRGPTLFTGYLNRPDATAEVLRDGWFRTGDLATRDAGGALRIVGRRATDLIKTGGYKVGAGEVEGALLEHPAVAEAAVKGEPDDDLGERIVAWIVLRDGAPADPRELADHVAALLSPHKRPRDVRILAALPRNEMGKVLKAALTARS